MDAALHQQRRGSGLSAALHGADLHSAPDRIELNVQLKNVAVVLLDIEGTTTPIDFVHKTLFGYARKRVGEFLARHWTDPEVRADVTRLHAEHAAEPADPSLGAWRNDPATVTGYVHWLMDRDRKSTGLKSLQGKIWESGYQSGELRGEVYPDVPPALERWRRQGLDIAIFSSGSVQAQQSLFRSTAVGDLTQFISSYFDTHTGPKTAPASYTQIAAALGQRPSKVLFVSDVVAELDAAKRVGIATALSVRPPGVPSSSSQHQVIRSFNEFFEDCA